MSTRTVQYPHRHDRVAERLSERCVGAEALRRARLPARRAGIYLGDRRWSLRRPCGVANQRDWGVGFNTVAIIDEYTTPAVKVLTGNNTTIYAVDLRRPRARRAGGHRLPAGRLRRDRRFLAAAGRRGRAVRAGQGQGRQVPAAAAGLRGTGPGRIPAGTVADEPPHLCRPRVRQGRRRQGGRAIRSLASACIRSPRPRSRRRP